MDNTTTTYLFCKITFTEYFGNGSNENHLIRIASLCREIKRAWSLELSGRKKKKKKKKKTTGKKFADYVLLPLSARRRCVLRRRAGATPGGWHSYVISRCPLNLHIPRASITYMD
jgi:hypothetical protein